MASIPNLLLTLALTRGTPIDFTPFPDAQAIATRSTPTTFADPFPSWKLHLLTGAAITKGAVCLDGSAPGYYMSVGTVPAKLMLHLQGGGWCTSPSNCAARAKTALGSSKGSVCSRRALVNSVSRIS